MHTDKRTKREAPIRVHLCPSVVKRTQHEVEKALDSPTPIGQILGYIQSQRSTHVSRPIY